MVVGLNDSKQPDESVASSSSGFPMRPAKGSTEGKKDLPSKNLESKSGRSSFKSNRSSTSTDLLPHGVPKRCRWVAKWCLWIAVNFWWSSSFVNFWAHFCDHYLGPAFGAYDQRVRYVYNKETTRFDDTIYTWLSDYMLTILLWWKVKVLLTKTGSSICRCFGGINNSVSERDDRSFLPTVVVPLASMVFFNGLATLIGGYCHQNIRVSQLQRGYPEWLTFRFLWTLMLMSETMSGTAMGCLFECARRDLTFLIKRQEKTQIEMSEDIQGLPWDSSMASSTASTATTSGCEDSEWSRRSSKNEYSGENDINGNRYKRKLEKDGTYCYGIDDINGKSKRDFQFLNSIPKISCPMWIMHGVVVSAFTANGNYSCARPAADIFLVGITITIPTVYGLVIMSSLYGRSIVGFSKSDSGERSSDRHGGGRTLVSASDLFCFIFFFILAIAPLVNIYPFLLSWGLSLAAINSLLHCVLGIAWVGQCWLCEKVFL